MVTSLSPSTDQVEERKSLLGAPRFTLVLMVAVAAELLYLSQNPPALGRCVSAVKHSPYLEEVPSVSLISDSGIKIHRKKTSTARELLQTGVEEVGPGGDKMALPDWLNGEDWQSNAKGKDPAGPSYDAMLTKYLSLYRYSKAWQTQRKRTSDPVGRLTTPKQMIQVLDIGYGAWKRGNYRRLRNYFGADLINYTVVDSSPEFVDQAIIPSDGKKAGWSDEEIERLSHNAIPGDVFRDPAIKARLVTRFGESGYFDIILDITEMDPDRNSPAVFSTFFSSDHSSVLALGGVYIVGHVDRELALADTGQQLERKIFATYAVDLQLANHFHWQKHGKTGRMVGWFGKDQHVLGISGFKFRPEINFWLATIDCGVGICAARKRTKVQARSASATVSLVEPTS